MTIRVGEPLARETRLADHVAEHITGLVINGTLSRGSRVPPERVLAEQFRVSRPVIREAVRTLISRGLLESRGGSGTYVRGPDAAAAARSVSLLLRLHHGAAPIPYDMVHEVRRMLELEIARLAAERAEPENIAEMEREVERQRKARENEDEYVASDVAFHAALAAATHNVLFSVLVDSIFDVMVEIRHFGYQVPGSFENALMHHERILGAVTAGAPNDAVRAMRNHLRDSERFLLAGLQLQAASRETPEAG